MSTILDALKKSEQERKLNKVPTLDDMTAPQEESPWLLRIIIFLVLLLILLMVYIFVNSSVSSGQFFNITPSTESKKVILDNETLGLTEPDAKTNTSSDEIVVNVVSYAESPEQRFVVINGKIFRQGDFIRAGLKVEKIKPESVIFNQRGRRLERQP